MLSWIREKFGPVMVGGIIGFIAFVFVFYGVFTPRATRGMGEGAVAGTVNGTPITISDYNREYNRRVEFFKQMFGGKVSEEQLKAFALRERVFQDLVSRKLMIQEAEKAGLLASEEEIRHRIMEMPVFQAGNQDQAKPDKDGKTPPPPTPDPKKFDRAIYERVLQANGYTPALFERAIREDLTQQQWSDYFKHRVKFTDLELRKEFGLTRDKRNVQYVQITPEAARKGVKVDSGELKKYLEDTAKLTVVRGLYERKKESEYKGKSFDAVKLEIASDILAGEKTDLVRKEMDALATRVQPLLDGTKGAEGKLAGILKPYGLSVKQSGMISRLTGYVPELGELKELNADVFAKKSPIDPKQGGKAKKYQAAGATVIAVVMGSEAADFAGFEAEKVRVRAQAASRKERALMDDWMRQVSSKAKIEKNDAVIGEPAEASGT